MAHLPRETNPTPPTTQTTPLAHASTPAINTTPIELDASAVDPHAPKPSPHPFSMRSPADEEDIDAEFLSEGKTSGSTASAKRAAMLASRSKDPGVIVDVPREPTAEEVQAARSGEGMVTPAMAQGAFGP